ARPSNHPIKLRQNFGPTAALRNEVHGDEPLPVLSRCFELRIEFFQPINFVLSRTRSEEHTSELQSPCNLVCRLLLEKKKLYQIEIRAGLLSHPDPFQSGQRKRLTRAVYSALDFLLFPGLTFGDVHKWSSYRYPTADR